MIGILNVSAYQSEHEAEFEQVFINNICLSLFELVNIPICRHKSALQEVCTLCAEPDREAARKLGGISQDWVDVLGQRQGQICMSAISMSTERYM